jgi:hypothetical protein
MSVNFGGIVKGRDSLTAAGRAVALAAKDVYFI